MRDNLESIEYTPLESPDNAIKPLYVVPEVFLEDTVSMALFEVSVDSVPEYRVHSVVLYLGRA